MSTTAIRPRLERDASGSAHAVLERFRRCDDSRFSISVLGNHVQVAMADAHATIWSPWLTAEVSDAEHGARISGRFSSNPTFFTMYLASVAAVGISTVGLAIFGVAQWSLGVYAWGLWSLPVGGALGLVLLGIPFLGQSLARQQLADMHHRVETLLQDDDRSTGPV
ncbi:MAG: hypothetical protein AAF735_01660 [Myxococcota bacterium]